MEPPVAMQDMPSDEHWDDLLEAMLNDPSNMFLMHVDPTILQDVADILAEHHEERRRLRVSVRKARRRKANEVQRLASRHDPYRSGTRRYAALCAETMR